MARRNPSVRTLVALLATAVLLLGAPAPHAAPGNAPASGSPNEAAIRAALAGPGADPSLREAGRWRAPLLALYAQHGFAPLWLEGRSLRGPALSLLAQMRAAQSYGLDPADYDGTGLVYRAGNLADGSSSQALRLDLAISVAAAHFVSDLHAGRINPRDIGYYVDVPHAPTDVAQALAALAAADDAAPVLHRYEPPFHHYEYLKRSLAQYRLLASEPGLNTLPPLPHRSVRPGEAYAGAAALAKLLTALGDLAPPQAAAGPGAAGPAPAGGADPGASGTLDPALVAALGRFQGRHGLAPDGALGASTFRALTVPLAHRVRQIELSMERSRWLPPELDGPPIIVNIPEFRLFAFLRAEDTERAMLWMDVIVGRAFKPANTPIFAADMRYVVFRPFWDVPRSIAVREVLPKLRANPGWAERNGFEIVRGQGDDAKPAAVSPESIAAVAQGTLRVRQKPGPENALGLVKFMLPNRYNVYLHSTPAQSLFSQASRAFSHGCVRVHDPVGLAQYVLREDPAWTRERIVAAMQAGPESGSLPQRVYLKHPIRVFMLYATALGTEDGRTEFFEDIYGHDAKLDAQLRAHVARGAQREP